MSASRQPAPTTSLRLALNYSEPAAALVRAGDISPDLFKCPDWPATIATARALNDVYVHFDLAAGDDRLECSDWGLIDRLLAETGTPYVNVHLAPGGKALVGVDPVAPAPAARADMRRRLTADVALVAARYGPERVIVENVVYRAREPGGVPLTAVEPEVIADVVRTTGAGLLLDLAHARLTCRNLDLDPVDYLGRMPMERLTEIHVTGIAPRDGRWRDSMPMTDEDARLLESVLAWVREGRAAAPWVVTLEYGGVGPLFEWRSEAQVIADDFRRLVRLVNQGGGEGN